MSAAGTNPAATHVQALGLPQLSEQTKVSAPAHPMRAGERCLSEKEIFRAEHRVQVSSTLNFRRIIDSGQTVVCDLSDIGDEPAHLLGAVIVHAVSQAAFSRRDVPERDRPDYTLFIDEFGDFCSLTIPFILSKARKRHLALCIAHQYVGQFDKEIADDIFANCGTLNSFKVGVNDVPIMAVAIDAPESELKVLPRGTAWIAYQQRGQRSQSIPIQFPRADLPTGFLKANVARTRSRYARTRSEVHKRMDYEGWAHVDAPD